MREKCANCEVVLEESNRAKAMPTRCLACRNLYHREWRKDNPRERERARVKEKQYRQLRRMDVLEHYGGVPPVCFCCGESNIEFLAIDHINGGGTQERKQRNKNGGVAWYEWFKRVGYPNGFQVLCHNCNSAKGYYGYCPHKTAT